MTKRGEIAGPWVRYQADLQQEHFQYDVSQVQAVERLQLLYDHLVRKPPVTSWFHKMNPWRKIPSPEIRGLYFWGGVGRGKTYLMDAFYDSLPVEAKLRLHFHHFMQRVHHELAELNHTVNPLLRVADKLVAEARVLCFDEFFVSDIGDAMLLANLLEAMFDRGMVLVATSNVMPQHLYLNGLQRSKFVPAIELIQRNMDVVHLDGGFDYRLRTLEQAEIYHWPLDVAAEISLGASFEALCGGEQSSTDDLMINARPVHCRCHAPGLAWFDFDSLCDGPRAQSDYIDLARCYHTILLSNVPQLSVGQDDKVKRFVGLVDEFYDRNVKLILSAEVPMQDLYPEGQLFFEFQRTLSRLQEMQSHHYLASEHLP